VNRDCKDCGEPTLVKNTGQIHWQDGGEWIRCRTCLDALRRDLIAKTRREYGWVE
jgi:hypothetical protein